MHKPLGTFAITVGTLTRPLHVGATERGRGTGVGVGLAASAVVIRDVCEYGSV